MCKDLITKKLNELSLKLSEKKTAIFPITQPIKFLGCSFRLTETGKVVIKLLPSAISKERRKLTKLVARAKTGKMTKQQVDDHYKGWKATVSGRHKQSKGTVRTVKRDTHSIILKMDNFYKNLWR